VVEGPETAVSTLCQESRLRAYSRRTKTVEGHDYVVFLGVGGGQGLPPA
jgi:hypothetical protein